jgi:CRISPR system Cascade subunit CasA
LGRLVPLSRFILLRNESEKKCIVGPTNKSYEILHLPAFREPSTTVTTKNGEHKYLPVLSDKHIWRELNSVLYLSKAMEGGALALQNIQSGYFEKGNIDIWVGGLESKQAKIIDLVEWNLSISIGMFGDLPLSIYQEGVKIAESKEKILKSAIAAYCENLSAKEIKNALFQKATLIYWHTLDNKYKSLIGIANNNDKLDEWLELLFKTMLRTYEDSCPHQTPRQIQAFAIGKKKLFANINKK